MYKRIPGNGEYEITIQGEIRKVDGSECELNIIDKKVLINIYGKEVNVDKMTVKRKIDSGIQIKGLLLTHLTKS